MSTGAKIGWIIVLVSVIVMVWLKQRSLVYNQEDQFTLWLKDNKLQDMEHTLLISGQQ